MVRRGYVVGKSQSSQSGQRSSLLEPMEEAAKSFLGEDRGFLELQDILQQEKEFVEEQQRRRIPEARASSTPFALAFSGGGIRAAAFQCGVLWRLAKMNLLKDVELMTAVSGGGYIAMAFASFCLEEVETNGPPQGHNVKEWYERVVAKTVVRMQDNAGDFVRDFGRSGCGVPNDRSGCMPGLPRVMDVPILLVTLAITVMVNPFFVFTSFMIPFVVVIEEFFGVALRESFCRKGTESDALLHLMLSPEAMVLNKMICASLLITFVVFLLSAVVPAFKDGSAGKKKGTFVYQGAAFVVLNGIKGFMVRFTTFLLVVAFFVFLVLYVQMFGFTHNHASEMLLTNYCGEHPLQSCLDTADGCLPNVLMHITYFVLVLVVCAIFVMPYLGSRYAVTVVCLGGPFIIFVFLMRLVQFRVFGPLTGQDFWHHQAFNLKSWTRFQNRIMLLPVLLLPFYNTIRSVLHTYYMRCLSHNFFASGRDRPIKDLKECDYCPLLLVTGTSSDYKSPICGDNDAISELSFTPLHCGSNETGYVKQPEYRTMGKCTALTAAGCVDAVALTLSTLLTMRFWLEALNLSWGDYILFSSEDEESPFGRLVNEMSLKLERPFRGAFVRFMHRLPITMVVWFVWFLLYLGCTRLALILFTMVFALSFVNVGILHKEVTLSPWIRQLQQAVGFHFRGNHPPPMLYVTDGGCRDCTTLTQLVIRRQERILLALAASDPTDDLQVVKAAIDIVQDQQLAHFYHPDDPRKDVQSMLHNFKEDKSRMCLHIGIYYNGVVDGPPKTGHLYIVKNRLSPSFAHQAVQPHLTVEEMCGLAPCGKGTLPDGVGPFDPEKWGAMTTDELGPFCCCDFSHYNGICGNCGPPFPHGSFSNFMYMTPMWANALIRLGFDISEEAVSRATGKIDPGAEWERHVKPPTPGSYARHLRDRLAKRWR
eukprot:TRINITY_DN56002_c0_g1_i1.p1 TRINITY_DN56002_c0_g1~~TRINITY_DN56002_c0_g1_i1.p1  ORF type:complete len:932 (+),score=205.96 TRINITY_DN56002_c0_g1_i1:135-2930(+)